MSDPMTIEDYGNQVTTKDVLYSTTIEAGAKELMADTPESKPHFWSSVPGIITALGSLVVALTGLITALYSIGAIGPKANSNAGPPADSVRTLASPSSPSPLPSLDPGVDRYKALAGKWRVVEEPPLDPYFGEVERVTWDYDAEVTGNVLKLTGTILFIADVDDKPNKDEQRIRAIFETTLTGLSGEGNYEFTRIKSNPVDNRATIRLKDNLREFEGEVKNDADGKTYKLKGRKLP